MHVITETIAFLSKFFAISYVTLIVKSFLKVVAQNNILFIIWYC